MLRAAKESDRQIWAKLNKEFMEFEIKDDNLWDRIDDVQENNLEVVFNEALKNPNYITIFMLENEGEIIGFTNLMTIFSVWSEGLALVIDDLYISPEYQGKGLGRKAMKEIENHARQRGYRRIQFQSEESNPDAKAFYMKLGFKPADMSFYVRYL